jgi:hypothetical protein
MGIYATVAIVASLLFWVGNRNCAKLYLDKMGYDVPPNKTNFHPNPQTVRTSARPDLGKYYKPGFDIFR